jgi:thioredoxin-dependent peroxiredoxin
MTKFRTAGLQPFGVNPASVESHRGYVDKMHFNFPLLSDPDRAIAGAYHALKEDGRGIQRTVYVIGTDGTVRFAQRGAPPVDEIVESVDGEGRAR